MAAIGNYLIGSINPREIDSSSRHQGHHYIQCTIFTCVSAQKNKQSVKTCRRNTGPIWRGYPVIGSTCMSSDRNMKLPLIYIHISNFFLLLRPDFSLFCTTRFQTTFFPRVAVATTGHIHPPIADWRLPGSRVRTPWPT